MNRRTIHSAIRRALATTLLLSAFLLGPLLVGGGAEEPFIDTAAPVERSQCAPCHVDLSQIRVDGLIFSHGNHLLVPCKGCHFRLPHRADVTERVPMEACFACHGVNHGMQGELATGSRSAKVYGSLKPRHRSGTYPVRLLIERRVGTTWRRHTVLKAKASNYYSYSHSYSRYTRWVRLKTAGYYRIRAIHPDDSLHARAVSAWRYVRVR